MTATNNPNRALFFVVRLKNDRESSLRPIFPTQKSGVRNAG